MKLDLSAAAITARIAQVSAQADLDPRRRVHAKVDMSEAGITRRIQAVSEMLELCRALALANRR